MSKVPICPECGSNNIGFPGICTYKFSQGKWRFIKNSIVMNESADCFHCGDCGAILNGNFEPPFEFEVHPN